MSGSELLATASNIDFALVELSVVPPQNYEPIYAGWDRSLPDLVKNVTCIHHPSGDVKKISIDDKGMKFNTDLTEAIELDNLLHFAELIVSGALNRQESRGAQYRRDFPKRDDKNWLKHTIATKKDGKISYDYKPVIITNYQPQERKY